MTEVQRWFGDGGDDKFRYNYNLNKDSIVFDVGGYQGKWSSKINELYNCNIFIFEPIKSYYEKLTIDFNGNQNVKIFNFGLSNKNSKISINILGDGSSIYIDGKNKETIELKSIESFIINENINSVDLLKLNVEGEEYNIMESIFESGLQNKIINYQIQFHNFIPDCDHRREQIRNKLKETHNEIYCYDFVWESWVKK